MIDLRQLLHDQINLLDHQLSEARFTRDHAATPTESHSDQTRQNAEQQIYSLMDARKKLLALEAGLNKLPPFNHTAAINTLVTLSTPRGIQEFLLVPDGLGGRSVAAILLLSIASPLAQSFLGQPIGYTFNFGGENYLIRNLRPNI